MNKLKYIVNTKAFHLCMVIVIIAVILFVVGILVLRYNVEGETNMPFVLTKIAVISSQEGLDKDAVDAKWAFDLYQTNDIYLYISKNDKYKEQAVISSISIENFNIEALNENNIKIYKPDSEDENTLFRYKDEDIVQNIEYIADTKSDLKNLKISNQGGIVAFRCSNNDIIEYKSNDEEINHNELLKKAGITEEQLKFKLTFDLTIKLDGGKEYKTTINLDLPTGNIIEEGTSSKEFTELDDLIFKREKN